MNFPFVCRKIEICIAMYIGHVKISSISTASLQQSKWYKTNTLHTNGYIMQIFMYLFAEYFRIWMACTECSAYNFSFLFSFFFFFLFLCPINNAYFSDTNSVGSRCVFMRKILRSNILLIGELKYVIFLWEMIYLTHTTIEDEEG